MHKLQTTGVLFSTARRRCDLCVASPLLKLKCCQCNSDALVCYRLLWFPKTLRCCVLQVSCYRFVQQYSLDELLCARVPQTVAPTFLMV